MENIENTTAEIEQSLTLAPAAPDKIYTIVDIAGDMYAFDSRCVLEILKFVELSRPERLPSHIAGLFEYDGKMISIVDIKSVLNLERKPYDENSMIVILKVDTNIFGVAVNRVTDIQRADIVNLQPVPYKSSHNFIECIYNGENMRCGVLNLNSISSWVLGHPDDSDCANGFDLVTKDPVSVEILHKRKLEYLEKTNKNPYTMFSDKDEFVSFFVGENRYCLKMNDIRGFYKLQETKMIKVPCTPDFILGLVNIKGDFICVIDIKNYFHSQNVPYSGSGTIIVLNSDEFKIGILADAVSDNIQIKPDEIRLLKKQEGKSELTQYVKDGEIYLIISVLDMLSNDKLFIR